VREVVYRVRISVRWRDGRLLFKCPLCGCSHAVSSIQVDVRRRVAYLKGDGHYIGVDVFELIDFLENLPEYLKARVRRAYGFLEEELS